MVPYVRLDLLILLSLLFVSRLPFFSNGMIVMAAKRLVKAGFGLGDSKIVFFFFFFATFIIFVGYFVLEAGVTSVLKPEIYDIFCVRLVLVV